MKKNLVLEGEAVYWDDYDVVGFEIDGEDLTWNTMMFLHRGEGAFPYEEHIGGHHKGAYNHAHLGKVRITIERIDDVE